LATYTAVAGGGNWNNNATWGGAGRPRYGDTAILNATSGNVTSIDGQCTDLTCTGYTGTLTLTENLGVQGTATLSSTMTIVGGAGYLILWGNNSFDSQGKTIPNLQCGSPWYNSTTTLTSALSVGNLIIGNSSGDGRNHTLACGSNNVTISGNLTNYNCPMTTSGTFIFNGTTTISNESSRSTLFNNFTINAGSTVHLLSGYTFIVRGTLTATGTSGSRITIDATSPGTKANLLPVTLGTITYVDAADINSASGLSGIVAHYKMNDNAADTIVTDSMGSYNSVWQHGNTSTASVAGKINTALNFDGSNDYSNGGTTLGNALGGAVSGFSVALWFKSDSSGDNAGLFYLGSFSGAQGEFSMHYYANNLQAYTNGNSRATIAFTDTTSWHHLVMTFDNAPATKNICFYLDNGPAVNGNDTTALNFTGLKTILGGYYSSGYVWDGIIDDIRVYNTVLSAGDVSVIYNGGTGTETSNLGFIVTTTGGSVIDCANWAYESPLIGSKFPLPCFFKA